MKYFWKNKRVLVTGATGFIGSHAVDEIVQRGAIVSAVASPSTDGNKIKQNLGHLRKKINLVKQDLLNVENCLEVTRNQSIVFNFAAMDGGVYFKMKHPAKIFRTNSLITLNILEASSRNNVERFFLASSIEVYPGNLPMEISEEYGFREGLDEKTEGYSWSKRLSEMAARMYQKEYGMKIAIARFGNIYGPRDYADKEKGRIIPTFITQSLTGKNITIVGDGMQERSFLYVTDLIQGVMELIEKYPECDPVNIASSKYITIKDLAKLIITTVGNKYNIIFDNRDISFGKKRRISIDKAKSVIGFKEKDSIETGIQKTIEYFKKNNKYTN